MQLKVLKNDGSTEVYYHTKVMGAIGHALCQCGSFREGVVDSLAEAVTTYISKNYGNLIESDQIHSIIQAVLSETGFFNAALLMHEHRIIRQSKRKRLEIIHFCHEDSSDNGRTPHPLKSAYFTEPWNKTTIAWYLESERGLSRSLSRLVAGQVEEKVLAMNCQQITSSLVRELIENELFHILKAEKAVCPVVSPGNRMVSYMEKDDKENNDEICVVAAGKESDIR